MFAYFSQGNSLVFTTNFCFVFSGKCTLGTGKLLVASWANCAAPWLPPSKRKTDTTTACWLWTTRHKARYLFRFPFFPFKGRLAKSSFYRSKVNVIKRIPSLFYRCFRHRQGETTKAKFAVFALEHVPD